MEARQYAVVSYLTGPLAEFAERLRAELAPDQAHLLAHITALHPRPLAEESSVATGTLTDRALSESELAACAIVDQVCAQLAPIRISLGEVLTFAPAHPTVYVPVEDGARHLRYLNSLLKAEPFNSPDAWEYVPHLTLATLADIAATARASQIAAEHWGAYRGPREFLIEELSLVREDSPDHWLDLHTAPLGG